MNSPRRTDPLQASRVFDVSTPILELPPASHVAVLHGRGTAGTVQVATVNAGWSECAVPVAALPKFLASLPLGVNVYLSQARFKGWRRTQLLSSVNAIWLDIDHYKHGHRWSDAQALTALLRACDEGDPAVPAPSYVIASGRGLAAVWLVEVLARGALPRWQALASRLIERFSALGIDAGASRDVARVLRVAGTMNTTPVPARLVRCVYPEVGEPDVYRFDELCALLLPYARPKRRKTGEEQPQPVRAKRHRRPSAARLVRLGGRESRLWADRLADLDRLLELRWFGALPPGDRDYWMLLAGAALSWMIPASLAFVSESLGDSAALLCLCPLGALSVQGSAQLGFGLGSRLGRRLCRALRLLELGREFIGCCRGFGHGVVEFNAGCVERCPLGGQSFAGEFERCAPDLAGPGDGCLVEPIGQWLAHGLVVVGLRRFPCSEHRRNRGEAAAPEFGAYRGQGGVLASSCDGFGGGDDACVLIGLGLHGASLFSVVCST